jgi:adenylylsulfate kinase
MRKGTVLWLMGPTSAGKSTLAEALLARLRADGHPAIFYDGDEMRALIGDSHGFSESDRLRTVSGLVHLANKAAEAGLDVIVAALTAHEDARAYVRENIPDVLVGFVKCSVEVCADRDPKGLYKRARDGEIDTLIGFNQPYEPPADPAIVLDTESRKQSDLVEDLKALLAG